MTADPSRASREPAPHIQPFVLGDFQTNCFVVTVPGAADPAARRHCWIVDCGQDPGELLEHVAAQRLEPQAILFTHAHADHIAGVDEAISRLGDRIPRLAHPAEHDFFGEPQLNLSAFIGHPISVSAPTGALEPGVDLHLAGTRWKVIHTPGHSPGGVTLIHEPSAQAIVGDTLFAGSIGRIDFPTSEPDEMRRTLSRLLSTLPDSTRIYPGHGPSTTIGAERRSNPYLRPGAF